MEMTNVDSVHEPDPLQMRRHLAHLFDGCENGRIEVAWTDSCDGRLTHAAILGVTELDAAVARAVVLNREPGQNVYIGQALRKPQTAPFGRCNDADVLALTALYVDIDDDVVADAATICDSCGCPPTGLVITGRHPYVRAQMLWRFDAPVHDLDLCRQQNVALARALAGDPSVVNPSRVLRLGGSVAWPVKKGRVVERTEFLEFADGRPKAYAPEQIACAFPVAQPLLTPRIVSAPTSPSALFSTSTPEIASSLLSVDGCMAAIRAGSHWHDNMLRLVGHWISRRWADAEIQAAAESMTLPGHTTEQTRREVAQMILGGRGKWNQPNPSREIGDTTGQRPINLMAWTADRYAGQAKPIQWLCTGTIPLGVPVLIAAMGGLGKSYLALDLALNIAAGVAGLEQPRLILGGRIAVEGTAVVVTAEDSFDAVHRRLNRIDLTSRRLRYPKRLIVLPLADAGGSQPLITGDGRSLVCTQFFNDLKQQLLEITDLRLVVFDPLQAFVAADVNADPAAAQFLWSAMAELAAMTGATIMIFTCARTA